MNKNPHKKIPAIVKASIQKYFLFLGILSLLLIVEFMVSNFYINDQKQDDVVLDLALNQSLELQRTGILVGLLGEGHRMEDHDRHRAELEKTVLKIERNHRLLLEGDSHFQGLSRILSDIFFKSPLALDARFRSFVDDANSIARDEDGFINSGDPRVQRILNALDGTLGKALNVLVEKLVAINGEHAEHFDLILIASFVITFLVLVLSFPLIFLPLAQTAAREMERQISTTRGLNTILNGIVDAIVTITEQGKIRTVNLAAQRIFGYPKHEMIGENVKILMPDSFAIKHDQYLNNYLETGEGKATATGLEVTGRHKNGTEFPLFLRVSESFSDGEVFLIGIIHDLTEQKHHEIQIAEYQVSLEQKIEERTRKLSMEISERCLAEAALVKSRQRLEAISKSLFEGILVVDLAGIVTFSNPSAEKLLGIAIGSAIGVPIDDLFQLQDRDELISFAASPFSKIARESGSFRDDDARFVTAAGSVLDVAYACSSFSDKDDQNGAIISFRDTEELKRAQQETLQSSKLASVGHLAAGIAHEINTPTQYIGDNLRFLKESVEDLFGILKSCRDLVGAVRETETFGEQAGKIEAAMEQVDLDYLFEEIPVAASQSLSGVEQVSRIVLAMKDFSHPGSREKTYVDINKAIESTLTVCRNEWKHVAELETVFDPILPPVNCMGGEINQVFLNLIVNAAHAIKDAKGDVMGNLTISTRLDGDRAEIRIGDDGGGIPKSVQDKIFDPFFTTKEVGKGTGQGLSVCRDIITDKHGGSIVFDTVEGDGTVFIIRLPVSGTTDDGISGGVQ